MEEYSFTGKKALVTGAGRGIGREVVKALIARGAIVYALSKTQSNLDSLKSEIPSVNTVCADLHDWYGTRKSVESLPKDFDLLVNNAAVLRKCDFINATEEDIDIQWNVNVKAVINVSQIIVRGMIERGKGGSIVNVSSISAVRAYKEKGIYCATKAALQMLTSVMAKEFGPHNIRVNSVIPTGVMTDMLREDSNEVEGLIRATPLGRIAEIGEVVNAIMFLLSDRAKIITGHPIILDGGILHD